MKNFLNRIFKIEENQTTIKIELIAGLTTFFAMAYIVVVNPNSMIQVANTPLYNACYIGGIIAAVIATLCMAFIANKPFALAAGMGLNVFFWFSFLVRYSLDFEGMERGYQAGLSVILLSGIIFLILSITGARKYIATTLPQALKSAMPAGIGLFIAFLGLQNANIVVDNPGTLVSLADFTHWSSAAPAVVCFIGFITIVVLAHCKNKVLRGCSVIFGILVATGVYYLFSIWTPGLVQNIEFNSVGTMFKDWAEHGLVGGIKGFRYVFDGETIGSVITVILLVITFCLVDMFDTLGTVYGTSAQAGMLDENGDPIDLQQEMLSDSIGTVAGALTGTSTITTFVESSSGVAAGGRTGLTAFTTAILFTLCLFVGPIVSYIPSCATACALIYVGLLMLKNITSIDFTDLRSLATAFMTLLLMICTYSITNGILVGAITYVLITLLTGKYTKRDIVVTIIAGLGLVRYIFVAL